MIAIERNARVLAVCLAAFAAAFSPAADYDYEVEYVRSAARASCVKTDLVPDLGLTFKLDLRLEGPFWQTFGGQFVLGKNSTTFFGSGGVM